MPDAYDLDRFVQAQADVYETVKQELKAGEKQSHWMWFIFPQHEALGRSAMATKYGLRDLAEAQAYWAHPVLGPRLAECCNLLLSVKGRTAYRIMGSPDDMKLRSCMTIFHRAEPDESCFVQMLQKYFDGVEDQKTLLLLPRRV
ncbi:DUF1810 domain-containing protein [Variovorax sp. VNK109]|uniref:DUF1810 domain-containing protein n=1 Tax=Variovorax sp. VNK109 TaxID=3400919 RepID=UPI003C059501